MKALTSTASIRSKNGFVDGNAGGFPPVRGRSAGRAKNAGCRHRGASLSKLTKQYAERVLDSTNAWELVITDEAKLAGLPESAMAGAAANARAKGVASDDQPAWRFTLQFPSMFPVMQHRTTTPSAARSGKPRRASAATANTTTRRWSGRFWNCATRRPPSLATAISRISRCCGAWPRPDPARWSSSKTCTPASCPPSMPITANSPTTKPPRPATRSPRSNRGRPPTGPNASARKTTTSMTRCCGPISRSMA